MQLETRRLIIRDFVEADFEAVHAYGSDPEVVRYMVFPPSTPEGTREHLAHCIALAQERPRRTYDMGIVLKDTGQLVGGITIGVTNPDEGEAAFSYLFNRSAWGQGYASEALAELLRFGFTELGLRRIADSCDAANVASARVMEKCGLRCVDESDEERWYAITAAEWQMRQQAASEKRGANKEEI
jgi:[ribosomal protein S5]-alanine N-acetyltransferase